MSEDMSAKEHIISEELKGYKSLLCTKTRAQLAALVVEANLSCKKNACRPMISALLVLKHEQLEKKYSAQSTEVKG